MRVAASKTPEDNRIDLLFEIACQETSEFACVYPEYSQVSKSALLFPVGAIEDADKSFDEVFTTAMSETSADENVDCPHCTCKGMRSSRIELLIWSQLLPVQSVQ
jgi:hypothetical protein